MREVVWGRRLELARRRDTVRCVTGHHLVMGGGVVEEARWRVADRADERGLIHLFCQQRHDFRQPDAGNVALDGLELAAHIGRRVRFWVPDVNVTGPALEEDKDDTLGFAPAGFAFGRIGRSGGGGLKAQDVREADAEHAHAADSEKLAAAESVARAARLSRYRDHMLLLSIE